MYVAPPSRGPDPGGAIPTDAPPSRVYQVWRGNNIFFLGGSLIFGPDVRSLFLTIFLLVASISIFCVFVARKLMDDFSHHLGIWIMVVAVAFTLYILALLLLTSGRDPGIIPRNAHPPEPEGYDGTSEVGGGQTPQLRIPRMKDVIVNGITLEIKYCDTCMLYRPPRCSHCSICNNCVERFDHHCPRVGQCIGLRNYRFFFMLVFSTALLCIYVFGFCWVYIKRIMDAEQTTIWRAMTKTPASIVLIIYTFILVWSVGGFSVFHLYLISTNQTTHEYFKYRYGFTNPYNRGVVENFKEIFWTSIPPSKNKFQDRVPREQQGLPMRSVGGGFVSPNMGRTVGDLDIVGRKQEWGDVAAGVVGDVEAGGMSNNNSLENKDCRSGDASQDSNGPIPLETSESRGMQHPRRSKWRRKRGSGSRGIKSASPCI